MALPTSLLLLTLLRLRPRWLLAATSLTILFLLLSQAPNTPPSTLSSTPRLLRDQQDSPNFDFDQQEGTPLGNHHDSTTLELEEEEHDAHNLVVEQGASGGDSLPHLAVPEEGEEGEDDAKPLEESQLDDGETDGFEFLEDELPDEEEDVTLALFGGTTEENSPPPFLPYFCPPPPLHLRATADPSSSFSKLSRPVSSDYFDNPESIYDNQILERSLLFGGTGVEIKRVLARAAKASLYGAKRTREGTLKLGQRYEGEDIFKILVL